MARKLSIESQVKRLRSRAFNDSLNGNNKKPISNGYGKMALEIREAKKKKLTPQEIATAIKLEVSEMFKNKNVPNNIKHVPC